MSYYIGITDERGTRKEYRVPDFGEMTVAEWKRLCVPVHELTGKDAVHEELKRLTGIPLKHLRRLRPDQFDQLVDAYVKLRQEAANREAEVDGVDFANPDTITHDGVIYTVPKDLAMDTVYGQWEDMDVLLEDATTEPEVMTAICAVLLVEQGKEYEGFHRSQERFETLPARVAMGLVAFFLTTSERLRVTIQQHTRRRVMSALQGLELRATSSTRGTVAGTA